METTGLKRIKAGRRQIEIIVDADFELDYGSISINTKGYPVISRCRNGIVSRQYLHRYIMGVTDPKIVVDHRNGDPLDNRKVNLRPCTLAQNSQNRVGLGVTKDPGGKWMARWKYNKTVRYLGLFKTKKEAIDACEADKKATRGEFHRIPRTVTAA